MALEWLKTILGDAYTEDIETKVSEQIGKGFVSREDYNAQNATKKKLEADLKTANETLTQQPAVDVDGLRGEVATWKKKAEEAEAKAGSQLEAYKFDTLLDSAILGTKGRAVKPIRALLDIEQLRASEKPEDAVTQALAQLKHDNGYLFEDGATPPPYAAGTGTTTMPTYAEEASAFRAGAGLATTAKE